MFLKFDKPKAFYIYNFLNLLILIDIIGLIYVLVGNPSVAFEAYFFYYDLCVCCILLTEFFIKFKMSTTSKKLFLKNNWIDLFASIPFDLILLVLFQTLSIYLSSFRLIRLIRIFKMLRMASLLKKYFRMISLFLKKSSLDKILSYILITIILFTLILYFIDPKMNLFDSLWFVITTVTTVGYGNVIPKTFNSKVIALLLVIFGVFVFSTITGAISSFFTERVLNINDVTIEEEIGKKMDDKASQIDDRLNNMQDELHLIRDENKELKEEIKELKDLINQK